MFEYVLFLSEEMIASQHRIYNHEICYITRKQPLQNISNLVFRFLKNDHL